MSVIVQAMLWRNVYEKQRSAAAPGVMAIWPQYVSIIMATSLSFYQLMAKSSVSPRRSYQLDGWISGIANGGFSP
jgi:hypothetical protein